MSDSSQWMYITTRHKIRAIYGLYLVPGIRGENDHAGRFQEPIFEVGDSSAPARYLLELGVCSVDCHFPALANQDGKERLVRV